MPPIPPMPAESPAAALKIPLPPGFDFDWARGFLADRAAPSIEAVSETEYRRGLRIDGKAAVLVLRHEPGRFEAWTVPAVPSAAVRRLVARLFDLDVDLAAFQARIRKDRLLGPIVAARPDLRLQQFPEVFEGMVRAIVGQQVSVAGARTVVDRLGQALGEPVAELDGRLFRAFPLPEALLAAGPARIAAFGLTRAKSAALLGAAEAALDGRLDAGRLRSLPPEEAQAALVALPGVGPWTASYLRMRALGDRDAFPATDLGVIKAVRDALGREPAKGEITELAEGWRPWRAYATIHLWRSLGG